MNTFNISPVTLYSITMNIDSNLKDKFQDMFDEIVVLAFLLDYEVSVSQDYDERLKFLFQKNRDEYFVLNIWHCYKQIEYVSVDHIIKHDATLYSSEDSVFYPLEMIKNLM